MSAVFLHRRSSSVVVAALAWINVRNFLRGEGRPRKTRRRRRRGLFSLFLSLLLSSPLPHTRRPRLGGHTRVGSPNDYSSSLSTRHLRRPYPPPPPPRQPRTTTTTTRPPAIIRCGHVKQAREGGGLFSQKSPPLSPPPGEGSHTHRTHPYFRRRRFWEGE